MTQTTAGQIDPGEEHGSTAGTEIAASRSRDASEPLEFTTIVITYNGAHHLRRLLPSLAAVPYKRNKVIVVDNASTDDSAAVAKSFGVEVMRHPRNYGFAKGNNIAMRQAVAAGTDIVLLLNDDTEILDPRLYDAVASQFVQEPRLGIAAPTLFGDTCEANMQSPIRWQRARRVSGCAMAFRASCLSAIGLMDQRYFAFWEETDLEARITRAGYDVEECSVALYHRGHGSFSKTSYRHICLMSRNAVRFSLKHEGVKRGIARLFLTPASLLTACSLSSFPFYLYIRENGRELSFGQRCRIVAVTWAWNVVLFPECLTTMFREARAVRRGRAELESALSMSSCRGPCNG